MLLVFLATEGADGWNPTGVTVNNNDQRFKIGTGEESGCITDNLTGLMWANKDLRRIYRWQPALDLITDINVKNGFCGHKDWHLPTNFELISLINYGSSNLIDNLISEGFNIPQSSNYNFWSSTNYWFAPTNAVWHVSFSEYNLVGISAKTFNDYYVLPVRRVNKPSFAAPAQVPVTGQSNGEPADSGFYSGVPWPNPRFVMGRGATESCVTDKLTGLMWVKDLNSVKINGDIDGAATTWLNALASVKQANSTTRYCGYTDWRLPNINELRSMINYSIVHPYWWLNSYFANVKEINYMSSTISEVDKHDVWGISFKDGYIGRFPRDVMTNVWPVRGGR